MDYMAYFSVFCVIQLIPANYVNGRDAIGHISIHVLDL